ncbi:3'-5' exonuclease family protein [Zoogloea sp.]|uniref:3'-5' exonuclease family protein n=1 Tax=Zoogloea sp. TaxID=49181 RepID=UPI00260D4C2D|nr:3'-5' exonuclease family protein [Zoogloea sp.]MDD3354844.1 exonuclease domain-containing protein [Zoogloea sp.]
MNLITSRWRGLAFVDIETNGGTATLDGITEIGIVEVDEDGVREWSHLVRPAGRIPDFIQKLTGISNEMVAEAPSFAELAEEVWNRLDGRLFVAHNARFDYGFLRNAFERVGMPLRPPVLCTVKLSRALFPEHRRHGLDALIERHGLVVGDRHRALADAQLVWQFWQLMHRQFEPEVMEAVVSRLAGRAASLPPHVDPAVLDGMPERPGVYLFYGENELPLYVGKSKDIRTRVLSHFSADHSSAKEMSLSQQLRRIEWIETEGEVGALLLEARLVKERQPIHNRRLRRTTGLCAWQLVEDRQGGWRPELVRGPELDPGRQDNLFGFFSSKTTASKALRTLAEEHNLCQVCLGLEKVRPGQSCFGYQLKRCKGACIGLEPRAVHGARLMMALHALKVERWPYAGPVGIQEGRDLHVVDNWCWLGTARQEEEVWALLESGQPAFDLDIFKILKKAVHKERVVPLTSVV